MVYRGTLLSKYLSICIQKAVIINSHTFSPGGLLYISSDGDDWRTFFWSEIFDSEIFLGMKIRQVFFWVA